MPIITSCDILLILCPSWSTNTPPLGIAYLSEYLREKGYRTSIMDLNIQCYNSCSQDDKELWKFENWQFWNPEEEDLSRGTPLTRFATFISAWEEAILAVASPIVGFSMFNTNFYVTIELIKRIKRRDPSRKIIVGGRAISCFQVAQWFYRYAEQQLDAFVIGEGEEPLAVLMERFLYPEIPGPNPAGSIISDGIKWSPFEQRPQIDNLDSLPFPRFDQFPLDAYETEAISLIMSRGCISRCVFCQDRMHTTRYVNRGVDHVLAEIEHHYLVLGKRIFLFHDLAVNGNTRILRLICEGILEKKLEIEWSGFAIPLGKMNDSYLKLLKRSGCFALNYGAEHGSNRILRLMGKIFRVEDVKAVVRRTHDAGISQVINLIIGFPGEAPEDFEETLHFIEELAPYKPVFSISPFLLMKNTTLIEHPDIYDIGFPDDRFSYDRHWTGPFNNTIELRRERTRRTCSFIESLGLTYFVNNY